MKEILFRGERTDNGDWVVDNSVLFFRNSTKIYGVMNGWREIEVIPDTVGQYTGLVDKNGTKIFEGDIVRFNYTGENKGVEGTATVIFQNGQFGVLWGWHKEFVPLTGFCNTTVEVIGNIYDNPELLRSDTE